MPVRRSGGKRKNRDEDESKVASAVPAKMLRAGKIANSPSFGTSGDGGLPSYITLTTHAGLTGVSPVHMKWGHEDPMERGPVVATNRDGGVRNCIGAHGGSYCVYRGLAVAAGALDPTYRPKFELTSPAIKIGPFKSWHDPHKIVTMDPFGHVCTQVFSEYYEKGYDIRPTIAVTKAHIDVPEIKEAMRVGRLEADGKVLLKTAQINIHKAAVEPVWWLPGLAERFGCDEMTLRRHLFHQTNFMYPELVTRSDLKIFLPPIGGMTIYIFGDPSTVSNPDIPLTVRVHDECNGSDVFGSDICTCRPYLIHGIEDCVRTAQKGGAGVIVYFRKEGRALGEVTKYLVYNLRKRQEGGDSAAKYFDCTATVAGVEDMRFQALMPDALHWLGITRIHRLISMSDMKYNAITKSGIEVLERIPIPPELVPEDAHVEIDAKVFCGYDGGSVYKVTEDELKKVKGRAAESY